MFSRTKRLLLHLFLFVATLSGCTTAQNTPITRYGIRAISDMEEYRKLILVDSSKALVELKKVVPDITLDIRYATSNNLMKQKMYKSANAFLAAPAARALAAAQEELKQLGYALKIYDAYRPYAVTVSFYEKVRDTVFVASPYRGSRHNRGCAVDLTLIDLKTGKELAMPTPFDDFTEKAHSNYSKLPPNVIKNRELLKKVMTSNGFDIYPDEWWHYDFKGWRNHPILDIPFKKLSS